MEQETEEGIMDVVDFFKSHFVFLGVLIFVIGFVFCYLILIKISKRAYLKCICGKQPTMIYSYPLGVDGGVYCGYECECGMAGPVNLDEGKAEEEWALMVAVEELKNNC